MKKLYSAVLLMLLSFMGFSQTQRFTYVNLEQAKSSPEYANSGGVRVIERADNAERGNAFWSEDFAGAVNDADNALVSTNNGEWTLEENNGDIWKYSTTPSNGCWSFNTDLPTFLTAADGFMIFDADSANCVNPDTDPPTFNLDVVTGSLVTPSIDCSDQTAVALQFSHQYRWCCSELSIQVEVSIDGGATYPSIFTLATGAETVQVEEDVIVNLSAIAPGEDDVRLKFTWNSSSHYYWALDDLSLFVPADYDLVISNNYMGDIINEFEYTKVPLSQASNLKLGATITNNGGAVSADAQVAVDVFYNGGMVPVDSDASMPAEIIQGVDSLIWIFTDYTPDAIGDYTVDFTAQDSQEDATPEDNVISGRIEITEFIYARDDNVVAGGFPAVDLVEEGEAFSAGCLFKIENDQVLYAIDVALTDNTVAGEELLVLLIDPSSDNMNTVLMASELILFDETSLNEIGADETVWTTIILDSPVDLTAGSFVLPAVTYFGGEGLQVATAQGNQLEQTCFVFGDFGDAGVDWYSTTSLPMVRLNFNPDIYNYIWSTGDISPEVGFRLDQNVPNPVSNNSYITFELLEAGDVELILMDVTGKEVATLENGYMAVGTHRVDFNLEDLAPGVYNYSLLQNNQRVTKSLFIE